MRLVWLLLFWTVRTTECCQRYASLVDSTVLFHSSYSSLFEVKIELPKVSLWRGGSQPSCSFFLVLFYHPNPNQSGIMLWMTWCRVANQFLLCGSRITEGNEITLPLPSLCSMLSSYVREWASPLLRQQGHVSISLPNIMDGHSDWVNPFKFSLKKSLRGEVFFLGNKTVHDLLPTLIWLSTKCDYLHSYDANSTFQGWHFPYLQPALQSVYVKVFYV